MISYSAVNRRVGFPGWQYETHDSRDGKPTVHNHDEVEHCFDNATSDKSVSCYIQDRRAHCELTRLVATLWYNRASVIDPRAANVCQYL